MTIGLRAAAAVLFTAVAVLLIRSSWERKQLSAERYCIKDCFKRAELKIAFITDVHNRLKERDIAAVTDLLKAEKPDAIILGGDIITYSEYIKKPEDKELIELISELSAIGSVFYGVGNHEQRLKEKRPRLYEELKKCCTDAGAMYIEDGHVIFADAALYFVSLDRTFYKKQPPSLGKKKEMSCDYLIKKLGAPMKDRMNILVMHSPMYLKEAADWGADLVLSGHYHGGTIRLPGIGGLMTPQFQFFIKECFGEHRYGKCRMIVSRGIGTHSINIRLNNIPEVSIINIEKI